MGGCLMSVFIPFIYCDPYTIDKNRFSINIHQYQIRSYQLYINKHLFPVVIRWRRVYTLVGVDNRARNEQTIASSVTSLQELTYVLISVPVIESNIKWWMKMNSCLVQAWEENCERVRGGQCWWDLSWDRARDGENTARDGTREEIALSLPNQPSPKFQHLSSPSWPYRSEFPWDYEEGKYW